MSKRKRDWPVEQSQSKKEVLSDYWQHLKGSEPTSDRNTFRDLLTGEEVKVEANLWEEDLPSNMVSRKRVRVRKSKYKKRSKRKRAKSTPSSIARVVKAAVRKEAVKPVTYNNWKSIDSVHYTSAANKCAYHSIALGSLSEIETILNAGLVTADLVSSTQTAEAHDIGKGLANSNYPNTKVYFPYCKVQAYFRNNSLHDVHAWFWEATPKIGFTSAQGPAARIAHSAGVTRNNTASTALVGDELLYWPSDYNKFSDEYKMKRLKYVYLKPGDRTQCTLYHKFTYDAEFHGAIGTEVYQPKYTKFICFRTQGDIVNDSANDSSIGIGISELDCVIQKSYKWGRIGGVELTGQASLVTLDTIVAANERQAQPDIEMELN